MPRQEKDGRRKRRSQWITASASLCLTAVCMLASGLAAEEIFINGLAAF